MNKPIANQILDEIKKEIKNTIDFDHTYMIPDETMNTFSLMLNKLETQVLKPMQNDINRLGFTWCKENPNIDQCIKQFKENNKYYESEGE